MSEVVIEWKMWNVIGMRTHFTDGIMAKRIRSSSVNEIASVNLCGPIDQPRTRKIMRSKVSNYLSTIRVEFKHEYSRLINLSGKFNMMMVQRDANNLTTRTSKGT